jgi:hypothetical protein
MINLFRYPKMPPTNQTKLEGEKVQFSCEAKALPGNVTVKWFREGAPVKEVASLETRVTIKRDGSLVINPVAADDSGQYLCEVSNGIGEPQSASAYLNVECTLDFKASFNIFRSLKFIAMYFLCLQIQRRLPSRRPFNIYRSVWPEWFSAT